MTTLLSSEVHDEILDIQEPHLFDESISSMHYYEYTPQTQANNNTEGHQISITINNQDIYVLPARSYLKFKGQIKRADNGTVYNADAEIALINNAMMYLFTNIKYELGSTTLESIRNPGPSTSMIGYLSYPDDFNTSASLKMCWSKDTTNNASSIKYTASVAAPAAGYIPAESATYNVGFATRKGFLFSSDPRGCFEFHVPLTHIFGFAEYRKVIYGLKHTLTLTRTSDTQALYRADAVNNGKVDLTEISWHMPQIQMTPEYLAGLRSVIEQKSILPLAFRARTCEQTVMPQTLNNTWRLSVTGGIEKPRYIIIGFQTARINTQQQNPACFDHLNLKNVCVMLNSEKYPLSDVITNFARNEYSTLYDMFDNFKTNYYGIDSLVGGTQVNVAAFKSLYPIIVLDVRKQNERLKTGVTDIQVRFEFRDVVPADTTAYAVILSDRFYKLSSDGKNMSVISIKKFIYFFLPLYNGDKGYRAFDLLFEM